MNMLDEKIVSKLRNQLLQRRKALIDQRRSVDRSWQELNEPAPELEETAGKQTLARGLEQLDTRSIEEVRRIDSALAKMEEGRFGFCEACGEPISIKRLQVLPEARHCMRCADQREAFDAEPVESPPVVKDRPDLPDDEMEQAIWDAIRANGALETQELEVSCSDGVVHLGGLLPSERQHSILRQTIDDALGFGETVDNIEIDRQPWERGERNPAADREKREKDIRMEGEDREVDPVSSLETGEPMTPPDHMKPENE